jgi:hypothetical protein
MGRRYQQVERRFRRTGAARAGLSFAVTLSGALAVADPLRISVEVDSSCWTPRVADVRVLLTPAAPGSWGSSVALLPTLTQLPQEIQAPSTVLLDLPAHSRWDLILESEGSGPQLGGTPFDDEGPRIDTDPGYPKAESSSFPSPSLPWNGGALSGRFWL